MSWRVANRPIAIADVIEGRIDEYYQWQLVQGGYCVKCLPRSGQPQYCRYLFKGMRIEVTSPSRSAILSTGHLCDQHAIKREMDKRKKLTATK